MRWDRTKLAAAGGVLLSAAIALGLAATSEQWSADRVGLFFLVSLGLVFLLPAAAAACYLLGESVMGFFLLLSGWAAGWKFREVQALGWRFIPSQRPFQHGGASWGFTAYWFPRDTGRFRCQMPFVIPVMGTLIIFFAVVWRALRADEWSEFVRLPLVLAGVGILGQLRSAQEFIDGAKLVGRYYDYFLELSRFQEWQASDHGFGPDSHCPAIYGFQANHDLVKVEMLRLRANYALDRGHAERARQLLKQALPLEAPFMRDPWRPGMINVGIAHAELALLTWMIDADAETAEAMYQRAKPYSEPSGEDYVELARDLWLGKPWAEVAIQKHLRVYAEQPKPAMYDHAVHMLDFILHPLAQRDKRTPSGTGSSEGGGLS